jgi:small subunit ribosomal protein S6
MATENRLYEGMFVMPQTLVREDKDAAFEIIKSIIGKFDGKIEDIDVWQERALAYEINHVRNATFILTYFTADASVISKIERTIRITDEILRALIVVPEKEVDLAEVRKLVDEKKNVATAESEEKENVEEVKV